MKLDISHRTVYRYDARMRHSTQYLRLTPSSSRRQPASLPSCDGFLFGRS